MHFKRYHVAIPGYLFKTLVKPGKQMCKNFCFQFCFQWKVQKEKQELQLRFSATNVVASDRRRSSSSIHARCSSVDSSGNIFIIVEPYQIHFCASKLKWEQQVRRLI